MFEFELSLIHAKLSLRLFIFNGVIVAWRVLRIIGGCPPTARSYGPHENLKKRSTYSRESQ